MLPIRMEPLWLKEAFVALSKQNGDDYDRIMSHPDKFGATREEFQELFAPYLAYRDAVLPELLAILEAETVLRPYHEMGKVPYVFLEEAATIFLNEKDPNHLMKWTPETEEDMKQRVSALIRLTLKTDEEWQQEDDQSAIETVQELTELLDRSEASGEVRYQLLCLYLNPQNFLEALHRVAEPMVKVVQKHFELIRERFEQQRDGLDEDALKMLLTEGGSGMKLPLEEEGLQICVGIFRYNGLSLSSYDQADGSMLISVTVGMFLSRLIGGKNQKKELSPAEIQTACKALGDNSRYRILALVLERGRMYLQEMAKELGLTPATVSHHIAALMEADLLQVEMGEQEKRVIYYVADREHLAALGEAFLRFAESEPVR